MIVLSLPMDREKNGWFISWFKGIFGHKENEWENKIQTIIFKLQEQKEKLEELSFRMEKRAKELFEKTVEHLKKAGNPNIREEERRAHQNLARTFAEEIYEIRAFLRAIKFTTISLEKAKERLQTVRDIKDFQAALLPVKHMLTGVKKEISGIFPSVGEALEDINRNIEELAIHTSAGLHGLPAGKFAVNEDVEKILSEAWAAASETVNKNIPEPSRLMKMKTVGGKRQAHTRKPLKVVVETGKHKYGIEEPIALPVSRVNNSLVKIEELILDEIRVNKGRFNVDEFCRKYGVSKDRVFDALQSLSRKGKIKVSARR